MPIALATLCAIVCAIGGEQVAPDEFLDDWGVLSPDEAADTAAQRALENLKTLAMRRSQNGQQNRSDSRD